MTDHSRDSNDQDQSMQNESSLPTVDCAEFEAQLGAWMEHDLDAEAQAFMTRHRATCGACDRMAREVEAIVAEAAELPVLKAPDALWSGIAARLDTDVLSLPVGNSAPALATATPETPERLRGWSARRLAFAAAALVSVTAGVTWQLASRATAGGAATTAVPVATTPAAASVAAANPAATATITDSTTVLAPRAEIVVGRPVAATVSLTSVPTAAAPEVTYEREIGALRRIVDERFAELDSSTVTELRRNLQIIDQAIADSRKALAKDPRSAFVSSQLDRALQAKLELMRRVALL